MYSCVLNLQGVDYSRWKNILVPQLYLSGSADVQLSSRETNSGQALNLDAAEIGFSRDIGSSLNDSSMTPTNNLAVAGTYQTAVYINRNHRSRHRPHMECYPRLRYLPELMQKLRHRTWP
jgi:hypothetical protein